MATDGHVFSCRVSCSGPEGVIGDDAPIFPYWSFTKTVIAICALRLAEVGKISLDETARDQPFTLRQLLGNRAGVPDYPGLKDYQRAVRKDEEPWSRGDLMRAAMAQGRAFAPGRGWSYSNLGYMLARELIEEAAGYSFADLVKSMIRDPLGLPSLELATSRREFSRVHWPAARRYHPGWVYHGCLIGTAKDAALLVHALFGGHLLNPSSLRRMMTAYPLGGSLAGRPWTNHGYGLGLMSGVMGAAGAAVGHSGAGPFSVCAVYHFPDRPIPVTVASFTDGSDEGVAECAAARFVGPE